ncbi:hypothetical protein Tco_0820301 [Tanacetum coccineum]|uniref:Uncharacterized protein n=1 Tax=Tanacetum coccineum TaxID=301880 RepID=A0ABQ5ABL5_9ASTR
MAGNSFSKYLKKSKSSKDYSFVSTTFLPLLGLEPSDLGFKYEIEIASGQLVEFDKVIKGCKLEIEGHIFDIDLIPFGHGSFDVIIVKSGSTKLVLNSNSYLRDILGDILGKDIDDEESNHEDASDTGAAPKQQQQMIPQTTAISNIKLPILKKEEYDIWAMEMAETYTILDYLSSPIPDIFLLQH